MSDKIVSRPFNPSDTHSVALYVLELERELAKRLSAAAKEVAALRAEVAALKRAAAKQVDG